MFSNEFIIEYFDLLELVDFKFVFDKCWLIYHPQLGAETQFNKSGLR